MSVTTSGYEFKRYYADESAWPEDGRYHDDICIDINGRLDEDGNGVMNLKDDDVVVIRGGDIYTKDGDHIEGLEQHFKKWKNAQLCQTFIVECDLEKLEEVQAAVRLAGGRMREV